ncbi:PIN domain-containing protein [Dyadobacter sp. CY323]|uniref:PIN domain-containing protein n=1 Tax=Dyadobacter sp. CY323 TaxID=2907302 RepID=UPI0028854F01|nr:PIN domain-containing protein [Dyadobacter sp. CY323]
MKLFLDTNVLVDHALSRITGQSNEAKFLLSWALENEIPMFISSASFYTFTYVLQKEGLKNNDLKTRLLLYLKILKVCNSSTTCFVNALNSGMKDIEDSYQLQTALAVGCNFLITNNTKDFKFSNATNISITSPYNFLTSILRKTKGRDF